MFRGSVIDVHEYFLGKWDTLSVTLAWTREQALYRLYQLPAWISEGSLRKLAEFLILHYLSTKYKSVLFDQSKTVLLTLIKLSFSFFSAFCSHSSSKLTQSIVKNHMVSHYKRVYSAKAAIDTSVPKSLTHSVKYNDQIRQERLRKEGRPQSAHCLSERNTQALSPLALSRSSVQYEDGPFLCSRSSTVSSPRFSTSFNVKEIVYPTCKAGSASHPRYRRSASELNYRSPGSTSHRKQSLCSLGNTGDGSCYKTFKDPIKKTYSGDLLQKHSQHFTQDQPFTPKTLKSDKSSYLSKYRYYRAPHRNPSQDCTSSRLKRQETYHTSIRTKEYAQECYDTSQGYSPEHEWSEDDFNGTYLPAVKQQSHANQNKDSDLFESASRVSSEGGKSPIMNSISAEEEELKYLEFISAVTEDILSKGPISDRVLDRVMNRHIDMNRHRLNEYKMRHLLDVLRKDFNEPATTSLSTAPVEQKESYLFDTLLPELESVSSNKAKTKADSDPLPYASHSKYCDSLDFADPLLTSTALCPLKMTTWEVKPDHSTHESDHQGHISVSAVHTEHDFKNTGTSKVINPNQECSTSSRDEGVHQDQTEAEEQGQHKEFQDLERRLSETLHISSNTCCDDIETVNDQYTNTIASVSDDEF